LPPAVAAATRAALRVSEHESWRRDKVLALTRRLRDALAARGVETGTTTDRAVTSIVPVIVGEAGRALAVSRHLETAGFLVMAIRPPTVPQGTARLRVTLSASHEEAQVDALAAAIEAGMAQGA
jgi:8-amino-7-oxononanoate synthase